MFFYDFFWFLFSSGPLFPPRRHPTPCGSRIGLIYFGPPLFLSLSFHALGSFSSSGLFRRRKHPLPPFPFFLSPPFFFFYYVCLTWLYSGFLIRRLVLYPEPSLFLAPSPIPAQHELFFFFPLYLGRRKSPLFVRALVLAPFSSLGPVFPNPRPRAATFLWFTAFRSLLSLLIALRSRQSNTIRKNS